MKNVYEDKIYYSSIVYDTIVDGVGFRNTLYTQGCYGICGDKCHNKSLWNMYEGKLDTIENIYNKLINKTNNNITFSGGECTLQAKQLIKLAKMIKNNTDKTIWIYSGYTYEELMKYSDKFELIKYCDVLVDGRYDENYRKLDNNPLFRGSINQRIIDIQKTLKEGEIIEWKMS